MVGIQKWVSKLLKKPFSKSNRKQQKSLTSSETTFPPEPQVSSNAAMIEEWMKAWQRHDFEKITAMSSEQCEYHVPLNDGEVMQVTLRDFLEQMGLVYLSFPDYESSWDSIEDGKEENLVVIKGFVSTGTHTGEPFAFGPFPALPGKGVKIKDDPINLVVTIKEGKIDILRPMVAGGQIGPASYYTQIGGVII